METLSKQHWLIDWLIVCFLMSSNDAAMCSILPIYLTSYKVTIRRVWRYQRGNQNSWIEEEQTTQWPKEKGPKDKQRFTKHYT